MAVKYVTDREFEKRVLRSDRPTLVAFRASWCMPSQDLAPIIDEIREEYDDRVRVLAVDAEADTEVIRRKYGVNRLPVTMLFDEGRSVDFIGGMTTKESLVEMLEKRLTPVKTVDELTFGRAVLESPVPVLVHFDAAWCQPSQALIPVINEVAEKFEGRARVVRVDFGPDTARLCAHWGVQRVPTLALFVDGQIRDELFGGLVGGTKAQGEVQSCVGLTTADNITQMVESFAL